MSLPRREERSRSEAHTRLQRLEGIVNDLIQSSVPNGPITGTPAGGPDVLNANKAHDLATAYESPPLSSAGGHLSTQGTETSYIGATHWEAVLEGIHDLQDYFAADSDNETSPSQSSQAGPSPASGPDVVFGNLQLLTLRDVQAALPPRSTVDKLLWVYFNAKFIAVPFLHSGKFQREYEAFWDDPSSTSFLWLSILFSTLYFAAKVIEGSGKGVGLQELERFNSIAFMTKAGECLVTGRYLNAQPYSIESLFLYSYCRYMQIEDSDTALWAMFGLATRLAQRMGYHRDPRHLSTDLISPFEAEMRRRIWFYVESFDVLLSFQLGMPAITHEDQCDTDPLTNLADEDFDESCSILPPPRPTTDPTPILFCRSKSLLIRLLRRVVRHGLSTKPPGYAETMALDSALHTCHDSIPPCMRIRPIQSSSFTDQAHTIIHRLILELLYLKSLCVLHRTYLSSEKSNPKFEYSRKTCRMAALQILDIQLEVHQASSSPSGRLYEATWMLLSLMSHNFLLAAMVVCLDLVESETYSLAVEPSWTRKLNALKLSHDIWLERKSVSKDAAHAARMLAAILTKVSSTPGLASTHRSEPAPSHSVASPGFISNGINPGLDTLVQVNSRSGIDYRDAGSIFPEQDYSMVESDSQENYTFDVVDFEELNNVLNDPEGLDWVRLFAR